MTYKGINRYGVIGNSHSAALVSDDGSIDWCCLPKFSSPSVFAAILDDDKGGRFHIRSVETFDSRQEYLSESNILKTTFKTKSGTATITDFMPCYLSSRRRLKHFHEIHRLVAVTRGRVNLEVIFEPAMNYARGTTRLESSICGVTASQDGETIILCSPVSLTLKGCKATGRFSLKKGQSVAFVLRYGAEKPRPPSVYRSEDKLERTLAYWRQKAAAFPVQGRWRPAILRSYLTLHLLLYAPSGAIVAAPTTSLPERIGGERNWDYRFTWLRDASLTLNAFFYLGHVAEARGFMKWLMTVCQRCGPRAQILYDIEFKDPLPEEELGHLSGYRNSRPVRIGNAAYRQTQLDVFGEILEAAHSYLIVGGKISRPTWKLLEGFVDAAAQMWQMPDRGIWEVRSGPYHFVHSKMMCWVALDRGIKIASELGYRKNIRRWQKTAEDIRRDILKKGWNDERRAFTQHYGSRNLDASSLLMPLYGFLPADDERMKSTIEATTEELGWKGLLRRYNTDETADGLPGSEGAFLVCSFWLVGNLLRLGKLKEATLLYNKLLGFSNHLGLFSEMADPESGEALGNFPQAFTHLAVIITGLELLHVMEANHKAGIKQERDKNGPKTG